MSGCAPWFAALRVRLARRLAHGVVVGDRVPHATDQTVCRHGIRYDQHCKECYLQGFCGCPECTEDDRA